MSKLENIADKERQKNIAKNSKSETDLYNAGHPDALSDGDNQGRGETSTIGTKIDIAAREKLKSKNPFSDVNIYDAGSV